MGLQAELLKLANEIPRLRVHLVPMLRNAAGIQVETRGRRVYLIGNTFSIKDQLKALGFAFDGQERAWWVSTTKYATIKGKVEALLQPAAPASVSAPDQEEVVAPGIKAVWRDGRVYVTGNTFSIKDQLKDNGFRWDGINKSWYVSQAAWPQAKRMFAPARSEAPPSRSGKATPAQVNFAMKLLARVSQADWFDTDMGDTGIGKPSREDLEEMSPADISALIDEIKGMY